MIPRSDWCIIIPVNAAAVAKTRLRSLGPARTALARAFAQDVVAAASAAATVGQVIVVGDGSLLADADRGEAIAVDTGVAELNTAIAAAESQARAAGYDRIAAIVADIACVRPEDIDEVLTLARAAARAYVADHRGRGTTVLTTTGPGLAPSFGTESAARHRSSGAQPLEVSIRLRFDIDDPSDIAIAVAYGVGSHTTAALNYPG
ncbi:MAG: 2-phospho-L-lactate guanylyltransferase [Actinobacteria bacterium]|nr:2-phospho-L-lactate guanylyltransferase [Actinomycetota bacterium]MCB9412341.1 2-phospho-L-lactate guanylyltransferase [Actinomycetota bacterium]